MSKSTTSKKKDGVHPWLITTGVPSVRRCVKASKEKTGEKCMRPTKKRAGAVGVKEPLEFQKAKAV